MVSGLPDVSVQFLAVVGAGVMGGLVFSNFRPKHPIAKMAVDLGLKGRWAVSCIGAFLGSSLTMMHMLKNGFGFLPSMAVFSVCIAAFTAVAMKVAPLTVDRDDPREPADGV